MMADPPVALDAEIFVKNAFKKGQLPFDASVKQSPVLNSLFQNIFQNLQEIVDENPVLMQVQNDLQGKIIKQEMQVFIYRLSMINSWALVILNEIHVNSRKAFDQLDDWIVKAVAQENSIT